MKYFSVLMICLFMFNDVFAQVTENPNSTVEQQLENLTSVNDDVATEDDSYQQELMQYKKSPLNLTTATAGDIEALRILDPIQVANFITYRKLTGKLLNLYELQAIPRWDITTIRRLLPFVMVGPAQKIKEEFVDRFTGGDKSLLFRVVQMAERSRGYKLDSGTASNYYMGSPQRLFLRYKYQYKNLLQYGVTGEKDAGEQFFKKSQKQGFDFYSAHIFARNLGAIKSLALGDYTVNLGQGLVQWMSLAFKKGPDVTNIKRQADVLRPYNSSGEIFFHRGAGITLTKNRFDFTAFASYRSVDANFRTGDTSVFQDDFVSSLQTSGFHRTPAEYADKGKQKQMAAGGNFKYRSDHFQIGVNAIQYQFKYALNKQPQPYNYYSLRGKSFGNYSSDFSYTYKNAHAFGEFALSSAGYKAAVTGLMVSVANNADLSFLYRNISKGYQSLYTNAFTEATYPTNEQGLYAGVSIRSGSAWKIDAYADHYRFPFIRYRLNALGTGTDYLAQVTYRPSRLFEIYSRFKTETKPVNDNALLQPISPVIAKTRLNWRSQFSSAISEMFTVRGRVDLLFYNRNKDDAETGTLVYTDLIFKPLLSKLSGSLRLQYFETGGYNSRLYAYENDVLYSYSIPVFAGAGYRYYLNFNYDLSRKITVWAKIAQTFYTDRDVISSGLDKIDGNRRTEFKFQARYNF